MAALLALFFILPIPHARASAYDPARPDVLVSNNLRAASAILVSQDTGEVLFEHNADEIRPPASTTKVMTVLLALRLGNPDDMVTVSPAAVAIPEDASSIGLKAGEQVRMADLIRATMVASGNDGAIAIAEHISGTEAAFVQLMNEAAQRYGCTRTNFVNSHGYHQDYHLSTARDLAVIAREAMRDPEFREIALLTAYTLPQTNLSPARNLSSQAASFLRSREDNASYYQYATGIKTGQHSLAGYCFIGSAEKQGVRLISVVLKSGSTARFTDTRRLMEYGFAQYQSTSVTEIYNQQPKVVNVSGFALEDADMGRLELAIRKSDPAADDALVSFKGDRQNQEDVYRARTQYSFTRTLEAPIEAGEVLGTMVYTPAASGAGPIYYDLIATRGILRRPTLAPTVDEIRAYTAADPNPFPRFTAEFAVIALLPVIAIIVLSQFIYKALTRERKPRLRHKLEYRTRYYR
ncbi:MAG TPA: D-alanyl-D-alanine carboxypeptidase family protein [Candidatus Limnocylindria bacterium]|nr:D-alanyl-D-alanine carboxypeptidase family protein [Candidatus Limnocylindria bacterium]